MIQSQRNARVVTAVLTVNADDYGYSEEINRAIAQCFALGYCSSASVMANMCAFEAACQIAQRRSFADRIGVHLVLSEGEPLSRGIRKCPRFCDRYGRFRLTRKDRLWRLNASERAAVAEELGAQIARCRQLGLSLSHADSHQHVHEEWGILPMVIRVCEEHGISSLRIARNCGKSTGGARSIYREFVNRKLRRRGLARSHRFGSAFDAREALLDGTRFAASIEVMVHPSFDEHGTLVDVTTGVPMADVAQMLQCDETCAKELHA